MFNRRLVNLSNLPLHASHKGRQTVSCIRACHGLQQNIAHSFNSLRLILQSSINDEINKVIQKYIDSYFNPAKVNMNVHNNENSFLMDEKLQKVCCQILEEAKKMYITNKERMMVTNANANIKLQSNLREQESERPKKRKRTFSSGSDSKLPFLSKKIKLSARYKTNSGRSTPNKTKNIEPTKKEGIKWDPRRLTTDTKFIMGSKANKALGLGATRGRLYIKHPDIFKYGGDQDDKQWLFENIHMPATGGRTYLLILDDVKALAETDEYRNNPSLMHSELVGFTVPNEMIQKMKLIMSAQRTDKHGFQANSTEDEGHYDKNICDESNGTVLKTLDNISYYDCSSMIFK